MSEQGLLFEVDGGELALFGNVGHQLKLILAVSFREPHIIV
jgi:hypothetical protein